MLEKLVIVPVNKKISGVNVLLDRKRGSDLIRAIAEIDSS